MWNRSSPLYLLYEFQMPGRVQLFEELLYNHKVILAICPWLMNHKYMCSMLFYTLVPVYNLNIVYHQSAIFVHIIIHVYKIHAGIPIHAHKTHANYGCVLD